MSAKRNRLPYVVRDDLTELVLLRAIELRNTPSGFCSGCVAECLNAMNARFTEKWQLGVHKQYRFYKGQEFKTHLPEVTMERARLQRDKAFPEIRKQVKAFLAARKQGEPLKRLFLNIPEEWTDDTKAKAEALGLNSNKFINRCIEEVLDVLESEKPYTLPAIVFEYREKTGKNDEYYRQREKKCKEQTEAALDETTAESSIFKAWHRVPNRQDYPGGFDAFVAEYFKKHPQTGQK